MTVADRPARAGEAARTSSTRSPTTPRRHPGRGAAGPGPLIEAAWETPPPRPIAERPRRAGSPPDRRDQALVAIGRSDRVPDEDIVARARAYEAGGAVAISVRREPHWFGGSVDDLRAVRAAVASRSWPRTSWSRRSNCRSSARPAQTSSCCSPSSIRRSDSRAWSTRALEIGLEPLVEVHDERELDRALATSARLIGAQQPRPAHARGPCRTGRAAA